MGVLFAMPTDSVYVLATLCLIVVVSEALVRQTPLRHIGTAVLVILATALAANLGLLPAGSTPEAPVPVYDGIFAYVAPLAIFWILLRVNLRSVLDAGLPAVTLFLIGMAGTAIGVVAGMAAVGGPSTIGPLFGAVGGMFAGTYTGGSVNFNAVALHYDVVRDGVLYAGAVVVDNIITTVWIAATLVLPRLLLRVWPRSRVRLWRQRLGPPRGAGPRHRGRHGGDPPARPRRRRRCSGSARSGSASG